MGRFIGKPMSFLNKFRRKEVSQTVVIGLDGVPYSLLVDLMQKGHLKNMTSIFQQGHFAPLEVSIPEISAVSWSSFMTGTQSGEHGIFGFIDLLPNSYKMSFPNFLDLKTGTLFDELGSKGKRSVVINLPATYPAREISGVLISGFVAIDLNKAVYPRTLIPKLKEFDYSIDVDTKKAREDHQFLFEDLGRTLSGRELAAVHLWEEEEWDLFILVISGTDRLLHFLWDAYGNNDHSYHVHFIHYLKKVDLLVGRFYEKYKDLPGSKDNKNHFLMLSDHGFTGIRSEIYLNRWLQENSFLSFSTDQPQSLEDIANGSKAFALDPSRIYINYRGRYPRGTVAPDDGKAIKTEIADGLKVLEYDGSPVIKTIFDRDDIYHGPQAAQGPDMVLLSNPGFDLKGRVNSSTVFDRTPLQGMHTQNDAFLFSDKGKRADTIFEVRAMIEEEF